MRRVVRSIGVVLAFLGLVLGGCSAFGTPELSAEQRSWCLDHQLPDPDGGPSVAATARELGIASPDVERALGAVEATMAEGTRLVEEVVRAEASGDADAATAARAAYQAWQAEVAFPAQKAVAAAMGTWSTSPEWAEACASAHERRGAASGSAAPLLPTEPPTAPPTPTAAPTPTPAPKPTPRLNANDTITYTSSTSVGRLIELTIKVRNPGPLPAGKVSMQVEGVGYAIASRTPAVGCVPNCRTATGAEGVVYLEWTAPAPETTRAYTVQLKANRAGTYEIEVRAYRGPAGDPVLQLSSWTAEVRVR